MTGNEIRIRRSEIAQISRERELSEQETQEGREVSCREMINSILVYNYDPKQIEVMNCKTGEIIPVHDMIVNDRYMDDYARNEKCKFSYIGISRVKELIKEQMDDYAKAEVTKGCYTDHEGCVYNSCRWADEI